ncbi:MAG: hypothetical protein PHG00_15075 [Methylococcales bacterium]|nr:hypothetical protein [Methylococcales bacterium]
MLVNAVADWSILAKTVLFDSRYADNVTSFSFQWNNNKKWSHQY